MTATWQTWLPWGRVHPSLDVREGRGYFHGHTWPEERWCVRAYWLRLLLHPAVRLKIPGQLPDPSRLGQSAHTTGGSRGALRFRLFWGDHHHAWPSTPLWGLALNEPAEDMRGPVLAMASYGTRAPLSAGWHRSGLLAEIKASGGGRSDGRARDYLLSLSYASG
ncbi:MAG: hypothetical protein IPI63_11845 [Methanothrix sp.]|uniref:hypothetical protein n=1 Tax=Methanothrix sp. TaxID=90426 RepID=UPI0025F90EFB|nr:hypothetical protein [Methanothrix sp.]MBK7387352.1 hypothetical protein [Methanothrix sp.]